MSHSLKNILKLSKVLFISDPSSYHEKYYSILTMFFTKITKINTIEKAHLLYTRSKPDIIIYDSNINEKKHLEFIEKLRKTNPNIPILVISEKIDTNELLEAIPLNLVDYLVKPVDINKLIYCLNKISKLILHNLDITVSITDELKYNFIEKSLLDKHSNKIALTKNEFKLLELLILNKDKTVSKDEIESHIWYDESITDSAFKSLFLRLRNKIGKDTIVNTFGIGYSIILK